MQAGLLNIPDVGLINIKQARAFLWNAAWLQEYMNIQWELDVSKKHQEDTKAAIIGAGGTGKTAILKVTEALITFFAGPETVRKLAPSNAAARLLGGDTIHALCKLPFGNARLRSKAGKLAAHTLRQHRKKWETAIACFLDEISMISADQLLQADVRMRQAKQKPEQMFGALGLNLCGDFLQLPPVDKDGSRKSLADDVPEASLQTGEGTKAIVAEPEEAVASPTEEERKESTQERKKKGKLAKLVETVQGLHLWRNIRHVVCLQVNVRAPGVLSRLQAEMRAGAISDQMWSLYMSRVMQPNDPRLTEAQSPFSKHHWHFIVHRHKISVFQSLENAKEESRKRHIPLYLAQAYDEVVDKAYTGKMTPAVKADLLRRVNHEQTKSLASFLPLYVGMRLTLLSKGCVRLGLMKGCTCTLQHIVFADAEQLPQNLIAGRPRQLQYMPVSLLLQADDASWTLPESELPNDLPATMNRQGLFQLRPTYDQLRTCWEDEWFSVRRTSFLITPADTCTVYAAQGSTYEAVIADMRRPPNMNSALHWLACYVMLSRAKSIEGLLFLRPATRSELSSQPPQNLLDELKRLQGLEEKTLDELVSYLENLDLNIPQSIREYVLAKDGEERERKLVCEKRTQVPFVPVKPQKRLHSKTTVSSSPESKRCRLEYNPCATSKDTDVSTSERGSKRSKLENDPITNGQIAASLLCGVSAVAAAGAAAMKSKSNNTSDITVPHTGIDRVIASSEHGYVQGMEEHNLGEIICDAMPLANEHNSATEAFSGSTATEQVSNTDEVKLSMQSSFSRALSAPSIQRLSVELMRLRHVYDTVFKEELEISPEFCTQRT